MSGAFEVSVSKLGSRRRDSRSVAMIYEELAPAVLGFFRTHRMRDAEDLTGDVFVRVTKALDDFKGDDAALRRWVFTIAHHRLVDEYRRTGRGREVSMSQTPETSMIDAASGDPALTSALATLTARCWCCDSWPIFRCTTSPRSSANVSARSRCCNPAGWRS
jgi:RNA polymerase sigma factor (sigma-70 family)